MEKIIFDERVIDLNKRVFTEHLVLVVNSGSTISLEGATLTDGLTIAVDCDGELKCAISIFDFGGVGLNDLKIKKMARGSYVTLNARNSEWDFSCDEWTELAGSQIGKLRLMGKVV